MVKLLSIWCLSFSGALMAQEKGCLEDGRLVQYVNLRHGPLLGGDILKFNEERYLGTLDASDNSGGVPPFSELTENKYTQLLKYFPRKGSFADPSDPNRIVVFLGIKRFANDVDMRLFRLRSSNASFILAYITRGDKLRSVAELASSASFISSTRVRSEVDGNYITLVSSPPSDMAVRPEALAEFAPREKQAILHGRCCTVRVRQNGTLGRQWVLPLRRTTRSQID